MIRDAVQTGGVAGPVAPPAPGVVRPRGEHPAINPAEPVTEIVLDAPVSMTRAVTALRDVDLNAAAGVLNLADAASTATADAVNRWRPQTVAGIELHDELADGTPHVHVHLLCRSEHGLLGEDVRAAAATAGRWWRDQLRAEVQRAGIRVCDAATLSGWEIAPQAQPLAEPPRCARPGQVVYPLDL